jgi:uncharacterized membrane protein
MTPRWVVRATFVLALVAVGVSAYLTVAHYSSPHVLACPGTGAIDCAKVTTSAQSRFLGIPVALLGLVWAIAMAALCSPQAWRSSRRWVRPVRTLVVSVGMAFVLWLVFAELVLVGAICVWCTTMHILTFALFVLIVIFGSATEPVEREQVDDVPSSLA